MTYGIVLQDVAQINSPGTVKEKQQKCKLQPTLVLTKAHTFDFGILQHKQHSYYSADHQLNLAPVTYKYSLDRNPMSIAEHDV